MRRVTDPRKKGHAMAVVGDLLDDWRGIPECENDTLAAMLVLAVLNIVEDMGDGKIEGDTYE